VNGTLTGWEVRGPLAIGRRRAGSVVVDENADLDAQQSITVGNTDTLGTGGTLQVDGTLRVDSGGAVLTPNLTLNHGSIKVRGASVVENSLLQIASDLDVGGQQGSGSVRIVDGGVIEAGRVLVGDRAGTGGETVTISGLDGTGIPSTLKVDGELHVAGNAQTQLEVKDGGDLRTSGPARVGENLAVGKVIVHGESGSIPASWDALDDVFIGGQLVASELIVEDLGIVTGARSKSMVLGSQAGDIGNVSVSDQDTMLNVGTLVVGADGRGELTIAGAVVSSTTGIVGRSNAAGPPVPGGGPGTGLVTIEPTLNAAGRWSVTGDCFVGVDEPGTVKLVGENGLFGPLNAFLDVVSSLTVGPKGQILGSGGLTAGHVFNHGFISPGFSPGHIVIEGDYEQGPDGGLKIEAAGLGSGQFDVLDVNGSAALAGKLELHFIDGYLPKTGDSFDFLNVGGSVGGAFDEVTVGGVAHGFAHELTMTGGVLRVTAKNDAQAESCADPNDRDGDGALGCNFVANPGMEDEGGRAALPRGWVPSNDSAQRRKCNRQGKVFAHTGECAYQLVGAGAAHELEQTLVGLVGEAGRSLTLTAWAKGRKIPVGTKPTLQLELLSSGMVVKRSQLHLPSGSYGYTRFARTFTVPSAYDEARIHIRYDGTSGKLLVDDVSLGVQ
jgi:T5SS/PEP-CTERM-associated repeat protein